MKDFANIEKNNGQFSLRRVAEAHGISKNRSQIIPGRFYQLRTMVPVPNITAEFVKSHTGKKYLDLNPVGLLLFHDNWKETNLMLNIKAIPPMVANKLLESYWRFSYLNGLANLFDKEGKLLPLEMRQLIDQRFYLITPTALSTILGVDNLNYAINKYNMDHVLEARLIDWDKFGMLVNPKFSTDGLYPDPINIVEVFEDFLTKSINV